MPTFFHPPFAATFAAGVFSLSACSPTYDWREVRGADASYTVLMPAKPSTMSRPVILDGTQVTMSMTATEVEGITFAVGTAQLPDAVKAQNALVAMKAALVKNIGGTIRQEKTTGVARLDMEAVGAPAAGGEPRLLLARFIAKDNRVYQVVMVGKEKSISRDAADMFFGSFKN